MRSERLTLLLLLGIALAAAYALLNDHALAQRMRDVEADDARGGIGDDDIDLEAMIARRRRR